MTTLMLSNKNVRELSGESLIIVNTGAEGLAGETQVSVRRKP